MNDFAIANELLSALLVKAGPEFIQKHETFVIIFKRLPIEDSFMVISKVKQVYQTP